MPRYHITRSFAISMIIVIAITHTSQGFTLRHNILDTIKDLETGGSTLITATEIPKYNEINMTSEGNTTVIALSKPYKDKNDLDEKTNTSATNINDINNERKKLNRETLKRNIETLQINLDTDSTTAYYSTEQTESTPIIDTIDNAIENATTNILNSETEDPDNIKQYFFEPVTDNIKTESITITENINDVSKTITNNLVNVSQSVKQNRENVSETRKEDVDGVYQPTLEELLSDIIPENGEKQKNNTKNETSNIPHRTTQNLLYTESTSEVTLEEAETFKEISNLIKIYSEETKNNSIIDVASNYTPTETRLTTNENAQQESYTTDIESNELYKNTTDSIQDDDTVSTTDTYKITSVLSEIGTMSNNVFITSSSTTDAPIEKPTTVLTTTAQKNVSRDIDMVNAESGQTDVTVEKHFDFTSTPMDNLKHDSTRETTLEPKTTTEYGSSELMPSSSSVLTSSESTEAVDDSITKVRSSKRAGFIDNASTVEVKETTTVTNMDTKDNTTSSLVYESEYIEMDDFKNNADVTAHRQMVEDAIKEELLKEENIQNNQENANRVQQEIHTSKDNADATKPPEDELSVKPLGLDKRKMSDIYLPVNYKPLKKINVQPSKQMVRDPDDNSWRNESISSLGIVFKPKNASKSFKEVLKNKTETELTNISEKDYKDKVPQLKVRLEKIAEARKKKKKINNLGESSSSDYEESSEETSYSNVPSLLNTMPTTESTSSSTSTETTTTISSTMYTENIEKLKIPEVKPIFDIFHVSEEITTTNEPVKNKKLESSIKDSDEYADYMGMSEVDIKKSGQTTNPPEFKPTSPILPFAERQPTIQYFPPTTKATKLPSFLEYEDNLKRKEFQKYGMRSSLIDKHPKYSGESSLGKYPKYSGESSLGKYPKYSDESGLGSLRSFTPFSHDIKKIAPVAANPPVIHTEPKPVRHEAPTFNRGSYIIKHYRDFIDEAGLEDEADAGQYNTFTPHPLQGLTTHRTPIKPGNFEDYDNHYRKDLMNKFVENFNQNSARFKVDFPVIYNNSVVHRHDVENGRVAQSSALMKRLYEVINPKPSQFLSNVKPCGLICDNITLDLSPSYELEYFVPEQEERADLDIHSNYNQR